MSDAKVSNAKAAAQANDETKVIDAPAIELKTDLVRITNQMRDTTKTFDELEKLRSERDKILKAMKAAEGQGEKVMAIDPTAKMAYLQSELRHVDEQLRDDTTSINDARVLRRDRAMIVKSINKEMRLVGAECPPLPTVDEMTSRLNAVLEDMKNPKHNAVKLKVLADHRDALMKQITEAAMRENNVVEVESPLPGQPQSNEEELAIVDEMLNDSRIAEDERKHLMGRRAELVQKLYVHFPPKPNQPQLSRTNQLYLERAMAGEKEANLEFEVAKANVTLAANVMKLRELEFIGLCQRLGVDYRRNFVLDEEGHIKYEKTQEVSE